MDIQSRLKEYLDTKGLTFKDFEQLCGLSNGTAARLRETTRKSTFNRIANSCDINLDWLIEGQGEMLSQRDSSQEISFQAVKSPGAGLGNEVGLTSSDLTRILNEMKEQRQDYMSQLDKKDEQLERRDRQIEELIKLLGK